MPRIAIYPGSFDPLTLGHVNIATRGTEIFDKVIIAVSDQLAKDPLFTIQERLEILKDSFTTTPKIEIDAFDGLLVDYVKSKKASIILRGIRTLSDFEYEFQMALANKKLEERVETIFMMTEEKYSYLSSTLIKEIFALGGNIKEMVPKTVLQYLQNRKMK